ncbi:hypothetical protein CRM22_009753 [Opisthorchis felineus]|uniref:Uncharacterized protein n=1 Tax=Opisthorchis felineus TaxID=147828 RepID=A0A4S2LCP1_OPIFE|nr:hypothetical protein CRM22_009753 [Opisthorchis felineus]
MPERLGIKIAYIFTVLAATALGIVYLGLDPSLRGTTQTATQKCASAFSIQAVILLIPTAVLFIIRVFKDEDELDVFLIISYSFVGVALLFYIIACGCAFSNTLPAETWLLSALWMTICAVGLSLLFLAEKPFE